MKTTLIIPLSWALNKEDFANSNMIAVHMYGRITWVQASQITHLEGEGNYTYIHTRTGQKHLVSKTLRVVMEILQSDFIRVHKSFTVNPLHVAAQSEPDRLILSCGKTVPIARRRMREIQELLSGLCEAA